MTKATPTRTASKSSASAQASKTKISTPSPLRPWPVKTEGSNPDSEITRMTIEDALNRLSDALGENYSAISALDNRTATVRSTSGPTAYTSNSDEHGVSLNVRARLLELTTILRDQTDRVRTITNEMDT